MVSTSSRIADVPCEDRLRPLRVLFVAGSLGGGGAERRLVDVLKHLDPQRIAPRLYLAYRRGELLPEVPQHVPIDAFDEATTPRSLASKLLAKLRCPCAARARHLRDVLRRHPVDVVLSWSLLPSYETAWAVRGSVPQLAAVGVEPAAELEDAFPDSPRWRRRWADWTYRRATLILANSADLRNQFQSYYDLPPGKVETWLSTRDFERIDRLAAAETPGWPDLGRRVIAAGRLHPQKGFDILLRAVAKIHSPSRPVQLSILGQGPAEAELRRLAAELGIAGQVRFLGFQANPFAYFRSAEVFVLSSRYEGLPNALIEAIACRTPVVATDCPTGPREVLENGRWGSLVPVNDVSALSTAIGKLLQTRPSSVDIEAARQTVVERFGMDAGLQRLERLLEHAVRPEMSRAAKEPERIP